MTSPGRHRQPDLRLAPAPARRALGYIRVSTMHEEKVSPEIQRASIEQWCRSNNVHLGEIISDLDISGKTFARKGIQRAVREVEQGLWDLVVVWKWSRFGRNLKDSLTNIDRLEAVGGELAATTEDFDTSHYLGRFQRGNMLLLAEMESGRIGANWREVGDRRVRSLLPRTGQPRFGYTYHGSHYQPDPLLGPILAETYDRYLRGETLRAIAMWLNSIGAHTVRGGPWRGGTLARYLDTGWAAGLVHEGGYKLNGRDVPDRWWQGGHESVIDESVWEQYQRRRRANAAVTPRVRAGKYLLTGLVRCGVCGAAMGASDGYKEPGRRYRCGGAITGLCDARPTALRVEVEKHVLEWLREQGEPKHDRGLAANLAQQAKVAVARSDVDLLEKEQLRLSGARKRIALAYAAEKMDPEPYFAADAELKEQEQQVAAALLAARDERAAAAEVPTPAQIRTVMQGFDALDMLGQRETLKRLIRHVNIYPRGHDPHLRVVPRWEPSGKA